MGGIFDVVRGGAQRGVGCLGTSARFRTLVVAVAVALLAPLSAAAVLNQYYVQNTSFNPGGIGLSSFDYGVDYNVVTFTSNGLDYMQLTLCDSSYQCYGYSSGTSSFADYRSISYGRAKCNAWVNNFYALWIDYCYASN